VQSNAIGIALQRSELGENLIIKLSVIKAATMKLMIRRCPDQLNTTLFSFLKKINSQ
jgi:hypothetical protein